MPTYQLGGLPQPRMPAQPVQGGTAQYGQTQTSPNLFGGVRLPMQTTGPVANGSNGGTVNIGSTQQQNPYVPGVPSSGGGLKITPASPRPPDVQVLRDSNPVSYGASLGHQHAPPSMGNTGFSDAFGFQGRSGGAPQMGNSGGSILGSSVGPPAGYGAGLAPASGLGGGLYPSLLSLYR